MASMLLFQVFCFLRPLPVFIRRIRCPHAVNAFVRRWRRINAYSASRRIMRLMPVFRRDELRDALTDTREQHCTALFQQHCWTNNILYSIVSTTLLDQQYIVEHCFNNIVGPTIYCTALFQQHCWTNNILYSIVSTTFLKCISFWHSNLPYFN